MKFPKTPCRGFGEAEVRETLFSASLAGGFVFVVLVVTGRCDLILEFVDGAAGLIDELAEVSGHARELAGAENYQEK